MPYYPSNARKIKTPRNMRQAASAHSRPCMEKPSSKKEHSKETIREVTLKLMAIMKAKRECQTDSQ